MEDKATYVNDLFSRIASKYDLLNDLMTLAMHKAWKNRLVDLVSEGIKDSKNAKVLDLCTGTGDIADLWIKKPYVSEVIAVDSCSAMLEQGYEKLQKKYSTKVPKLTMLQADAMQLPFPDNHFDAVTVGFGLRNVKDPDVAIREIFRVLKPSGFLGSLDLGHPRIPMISNIYKNLFLKFIPALGKNIARDKDAYQYLVDSLKTWPPQQQFSQALYEFGFNRSFYEDIMLGAIAIVIAQK